METLVTFFQYFLKVFIDSAQWLLLGYCIAGIIKVFISNDFLQRHLGGNQLDSVIKGALLGAPIPLCSCGVIPAAMGLRRSGASKSATTSFLIATPETGVDSVFITYALLGPFMAIIRPIAAITTAITAGIAVMFFENRQSEKSNQENKKNTKKSCCSSAKKQKINLTFKEKLISGLRFIFIDMIADTVVWLLLGLAIAAAIMTFLPPTFLQNWGSGKYAYLVMAMIGVPMYVCATSSTPIAAGLLFAGVSPGAILVFLLVGPATNIATLGIVKNEMGKQVLAIYLLTIVVVGFLFAWLTDYLTANYEIASVQAVHSHAMGSSLAIISAIVLAIFMLKALYNKTIKHFS